MTYDTGYIRNGEISRMSFDPAVVRRELAIIRDDLHCNAVQVIGGDPGRLELATSYAAELGLEVWFSPYPLELRPAEILALFTDCAGRAERLRKSGAEVVFVAGVELSIMNQGFMPGDSVDERLSLLLSDLDRRREWLAGVSARLNDFLRSAVAVVRDLVAGGKPVAVTGFGTAAYLGAGDRGGRVMEIIEYDEGTGTPVRLNGEYVRDEAGQAAYLREVLEVFDAEGVDGAFVFIFALYNFPHRPDGDPRLDLDMASLGIVKMLEGRNGDAYPGMDWEPKAAFAAVADCYSS